MNWIAFVLGICAVIATERIVSVIREFLFDRHMASIIANSEIVVGDDDEEAEDEHQGRNDPA